MSQGEFERSVIYADNTDVSPTGAEKEAVLKDVLLLSCKNIKTNFTNIPSQQFRKY